MKKRASLNQNWIEDCVIDFDTGQKNSTGVLIKAEVMKNFALRSGNTSVDERGENGCAAKYTP